MATKTKQLNQASPKKVSKKSSKERKPVGVEDAVSFTTDAQKLHNSLADKLMESDNAARSDPVSRGNENANEQRVALELFTDQKIASQDFNSQ